MDETEFDVEQLKAEIRQEVEGRRGTSRSFMAPRKGGAQDTLGFLPQGTDLTHIRSVISAADAESDVGLHLPPMVRFTGLKRKLALFVGRQVLYLSSFITEKQRSFNKMVVYGLWEMSKLQEQTLSTLGERHAPGEGGGAGGRVEALERRIDAQEQEIRRLEERVLQLTDRLEHRTGETGNTD